jgi:hypothetical protein
MGHQFGWEMKLHRIAKELITIGDHSNKGIPEWQRGSLLNGTGAV